MVKINGMSCMKKQVYRTCELALCISYAVLKQVVPMSLHVCMCACVYDGTYPWSTNILEGNVPAIMLKK